MSDESFQLLIQSLSAKRGGLLSHEEFFSRYAETVAESLFVDSSSPAPDCRSCGACCAYFQQVPVAATDPTPRRLTWAVWDGQDSAGPKLYWLRREPERARCVALAGEPGERVSCSVYELRPKSCREFEAGSDRCHALRRTYGFEPPLTEEEKNLRARLLDEAGAAEPEEDEPIPAGDRARTLREMIGYNAAKVDEITAEISRLMTLYAKHQQIRVKCDFALRATGRERAALEEVISVTEKTPGANLLAAAEQSQACLERASARLISIGARIHSTPVE